MRTVEFGRRESVLYNNHYPQVQEAVETESQSVLVARNGREIPGSRKVSASRAFLMRESISFNFGVS